MLIEQFTSEQQSNACSEAGVRLDQRASATAPPIFKERRHSEFYDVINASLKINTAKKFCEWAQGDLQSIFPHGMLICGIGKIEKCNAHIHQLLTCKFPKEYLHAMHQTGGLGVSPVVLQWLKTRRPVLFEYSQQYTRSAWLDNCLI
jgi:hypothetical protein